MEFKRESQTYSSINRSYRGNGYLDRRRNSATEKKNWIPSVTNKLWKPFKLSSSRIGNKKTPLESHILEVLSSCPSSYCGANLSTRSGIQVASLSEKIEDHVPQKSYESSGISCVIMCASY
ncbi:hypothetical protein CEXT_376651 [Caerostris extrusa]|uniref:Uncharacterized protein n=1 Tax=Caerostris extrusa TaxID=172846 RepID=A0AAV4NUB9_CAEEX|nr:hypothetical protein CEXT_376651 [Caerostris extrusa]